MRRQRRIFARWKWPGIFRCNYSRPWRGGEGVSIVGSVGALEVPFVISMAIPILDSRLRFPDPRRANSEGLVAIGGDLSVPRLLLAYRSGIFPWTADPVTWWSPDPRAVFELEQSQGLE